MKKLLNSPLVLRLLGLVLGGYMQFTSWSTRWRVVDADIVQRVRGKPFILCFWHGRLLLVHAGYLRQPGIPKTAMLISQSKEGEVVARATHTLGVGTIRGSSETKSDKDKGAYEALREMIRRLRTGDAIAITPDGPKGPRMRAQLGAVQLARMTGAPLVGLAWSTERRKVFDSWDRFVLPWPFGRGAYVFGGPIYVGRDTDLEEARLALEVELTRITQTADTLVGAAPVEPEALPTPALADAAA